MNPRRIDYEEVPRSEFIGRWRRALRRLKSMESSQQAGDWEAAQILAVHAAIAAADACTIYNLGLRCASSRHQDAESLVKRISNDRGVRTAARHLTRILEVKGVVEYSGREPRPDETAALCDHARKFVEFVARTLPSDLGS